jgi:outer membrane protein
MPRSLEEALKIADSENPQVLAAIFQERAQEYQVKQVRGQLLPEVNLQATYTHGTSPAVGVQRSDDATVMGVVTMPLYEGGAVSAQIWQAKEMQSQLRQQIDVMREQVRASVATAWANYTNGRLDRRRRRRWTPNDRLAGEDEEKVGQRTLLDTLNARNVLQQSEVTLQTAKHDLVVGAYAVVASIGRLSAAELNLQVSVYDPTQHYRGVKDQWYGWQTSVESREDPVVAPITDPGVTPGQQDGDGPAFSRD